MTPPATAAGRFAAACLIGMALGMFYGFLRPLRRRGAAWPDLLFLLAAGWGWLCLCFGICRGDLRIAYVLGMIFGGLTLEWTAGWLLQPFFS